MLHEKRDLRNQSLGNHKTMLDLKMTLASIIVEECRDLLPNNGNKRDCQGKKCADFYFDESLCNKEMWRFEFCDCYSTTSPCGYRLLKDYCKKSCNSCAGRHRVIQLENDTLTMKIIYY